MRLKNKKLIFLLLVVTGVLLWAFMRAVPSLPPQCGPLMHECYVWQRVWDENLREAIRAAEADVKGFTVLAAEIDVRPGRQQQMIVPVDYSSLSAVSVPVGVAVGINPYSGPFDEDAPAAHSIRQCIRTVLERSTAAGFTPAEIQIDYDCAESKLSGYRKWLRFLKKEFSDHSISITALPSWMNNRQFKKLIRDCDGYVLQVHSLERPETIADPVTLCDPKRALDWVRQADRLGVPFRLALPTYGYLVAYDQQGQFTGLAAEGAMPGWPENTQIKTVLSDPKKIAAMIQEIQTISPKNLSGAIWFRLPVSSDQLNWQWHTLRCIIQGQTLTEKIEVACEWPDSNLAEVYLVNSGDIDVSAPIMVSLTFKGDCLAADGMSGYAIADDKEGNILIRPNNTDPGWRIRSQEKIKIAWCRFDKETEVKANVQQHLQ